MQLSAAKKWLHKTTGWFPSVSKRTQRTRYRGGGVEFAQEQIQTYRKY